MEFALLGRSLTRTGEVRFVRLATAAVSGLAIATATTATAPTAPSAAFAASAIMRRTVSIGFRAYAGFGWRRTLHSGTRRRIRGRIR
jgi:hypothetical protein